MNKLNKLLEFIRELDFLTLSSALCISTLSWNLRLNSYCIILFVVVNGLISFLNSHWRYFNYKYFFSASFLFWIGIIWLLNSSDLDTGVKHLEHSLSLFVFPFIFSLSNMRMNKGRELILLLFLFSCVLRYLFFLFQVIELELIFIADYWKELALLLNDLFKEKVMHPTYFGMFLGMSSFICYQYYSEARSKKRRLSWGLFMALLLLLNLALLPKAAFIGTVIALLIGIMSNVINNYSKRKLVKSSLALVTIGVCIGVFLVKVPNSIIQEAGSYYDILKGEKPKDAFNYNQFGTNFNQENWYKTNRIHIWKASLAVISEHWFFGVGTGDADSALREAFLEQGQTILADRNTNTHNQYFDFLMRFGFIGIFMIIAVIWHAYRNLRERNDILFLMFLILIGFTMLTENILNRQYGVVFFSFFFSYFLLPHTSSKTD